MLGFPLLATFLTSPLLFGGVMNSGINEGGYSSSKRKISSTPTPSARAMRRSFMVRISSFKALHHLTLGPICSENSPTPAVV